MIYFLLYALSILACVAFGTMNFKRSGFDSDFNFFAAIYSLLFFLIPLGLMYSSGSYTYLLRRYDVGLGDFRFGITCFLVFIFGYFVTNRVIETYFASTRVSLVEEYRPLNEVARNLLTLMLIVSLGYLYAIDFGLQAHLIRRGEAESNPFILVAMTALYSMAVILVVDAEKARRRPLVMGTLFVALACIAVFIGGRMRMAMTISLALLHFRFPIKTAILLGVVTLPFTLPLVAAGKSIVFAISTGSSVFDVLFSMQSGNPTDTYLYNFSHPVASLLNIDGLIALVGGYRYFFDIPHGILFYLRLVGIDLGDSLTYYNTENLLGLRQSTVPPGYLAFGYSQAAYIGVLFSGAMYRLIGLLGRWVLYRSSLGSPILSFYIAMVCADSFYVGEPRTLVIKLGLPFLFILAYSGRFLRKARS